MRIFEKISRRLAITLAGVMACSSFAVAPALTARAAEDEQPTIQQLQEKAIELKNDADYTSEKVFKVGELDTYKIKSDIDGKLRVFVKAKDASTVNVQVWKENETTNLIDAQNQDIAAGKNYEGTKDIKSGTYYIWVTTTKNDATLQVKADIITDKTSKIRNAESPAKKTAKVTIKKAKKVDGYEVRFSTSKDFDKNVKTKSVKAKKIEFKDKKGTIEVRGLKSGKKYYVQVRTYVKENGVKYYSDWSKSKKIAKVK
ncbi:hypothetical protein [Butyrivibrio sp. FC2001]|uniref:hypothetical protein n=1 Tax=Butyrivibrio sp. FC2001 TaxID=1280671 RepID=UPI0004271937|nr:hypothetical protein [Butyrivibrio sp. FC2001]